MDEPAGEHCQIARISSAMPSMQSLKAINYKGPQAAPGPPYHHALADVLYVLGGRSRTSNQSRTVCCM